MTEPTSEAQLVTVVDGVHAWIGAGGDSNAGAIETPEGVIVIDTQQYPRLARQLRAAVLGKTGKPLRAVVTVVERPRPPPDPVALAKLAVLG